MEGKAVQVGNPVAVGKVVSVADGVGRLVSTGDGAGEGSVGVGGLESAGVGGLGCETEGTMELVGILVGRPDGIPEGATVG